MNIQGTYKATVELFSVIVNYYSTFLLTYFILTFFLQNYFNTKLINGGNIKYYNHKKCLKIILNVTCYIF